MNNCRKFALVFCFAFFTFNTNAQNFDKWEKSISDFEKADKINPPKEKPILFTGSSSIVRWKSLATDFQDKYVLNRGFGGSQTFEVAHFADRIIKPYRPKQVVVYSGDNEILAGKTPEMVLADFQGLFQKIREANKKATITFISIKPSPSLKRFMPQILQSNQLIKEWLANQKNSSYVDIFNPMLLPNGKPKPELFRPDSLHLLPAGYELWAKIVKPYLK